MKVKDIQVGDVLITGKRDEIREGRGGEEVYVLAVGPYTEVTYTCGPGVREVPNLRETRVVVARRRKYRDNEWVPCVLNTRVLMSHAEYKAKNDVLRKQEREMQRYREEGAAAAREAATAIAADLGLPTESVRVNAPWRKGDQEIRASVEISAEQLKMMIGETRLNELIKPYRLWLEKPSPDVCQL